MSTRCSHAASASPERWDDESSLNAVDIAAQAHRENHDDPVLLIDAVQDAVGAEMGAQQSFVARRA